MFIEKVVSKGLAHNSYIAGDGEEAFVVDPKRDVDSYINIADSRCCRIRFVFETHRNEDYLIGSRELERITGCRIIHSGRLDFGYGEPVSEGDTFDIGEMRLHVLETPGHTPESLSFVLYPPQEEIPLAVFTGDALFYGSTGRTDLLGEGKKAELASLLHDSLHGKLLSLGDHVILYPAHGAGSACGGNIADLPTSTIGYERLTNPVLSQSKEEFIERKKRETIPFPPYFSRMRDYNHRGPPLLEKIRVEPLDASEFAEAMPECIVVDTRSPLSFASGHIPGSYNIWLDGLAKFAGWMLKYNRDILLVTERQEDVEITRRYLARVGFDRTKGYLCEGIEDWQDRGMPLEQSGVETVAGLYEKMKEKKDMFLLDVREKREYAAGHIPGAVNIYVGELEDRLKEVPSDRPVVSTCSVGHRGGIGTSILKRHGYREVYNLLGGTIAWKEKGYPVKAEKS
ncbi:MAG: rhodanese-like domain-containing protein [Candidatus Methanoperedens sp.]|nr:rhodanese-like domain-containing protein [Candidatus Methanoperedens sp.]